MKEAAKAFAKSILSVGTIVLLAIMIFVSMTWIWMQKNASYARISIAKISDGLNYNQDTQNYLLQEKAQEVLDENLAWAMLLDESGHIIYSYQMPEALNKTYSLNQIAAASKWYLDDYPVEMWTREDGLFIVGYPITNMFRYNILMRTELLESVAYAIPLIVSAVLLVAVLLAWLFGFRQYRALKRIESGITTLANQKFETLPESGALKTAEKQINSIAKQLSDQRSKIESRDAARTNWISAVSHDIRTPLSLIMGYAEELSLDDRLLPEQKRKAASIRQQSLRIRQLVQDLNLTSKLEYEMQPLRKEKLVLAPFLRKVAVDYINQGFEAFYNWDIRIDKPEEELCVLADAALLKRGIINLLNNSIENNPNGCMLSIKLQQKEEFAQVIIADNGRGVSADILKEIQLSAQQNLSQTDANSRKRGMGLRITAQITKAHGGFVKFDSEENKGLVAYLFLPKYVEA